MPLLMPFYVCPSRNNLLEPLTNDLSRTYEVKMDILKDVHRDLYLSYKHADYYHKHQTKTPLHFILQLSCSS